MRISLVVFLLAAALSAPLAAQAPQQALAAVPPGSVLRVQTLDGRVLEGAVRLGGDSLHVETDSGVRAVAFSDLRSAWLRQRYTRRAAVGGALIGAAAGGAYLGLLALVADAEAGPLVAIGVLGGGAAGGLLGGVVGAAVPRWTLLYPTGTGERLAVPRTDTDGGRSGRRRLGSVDGAVGYGVIGGDEPTSGGPGGRLGLNAEFGAAPGPDRTVMFWSVGPEIGTFALGETDRLERGYFSGDTVELTRRYAAATAGGVLRVGLEGGAWRGYGLGGLAYNRWRTEDLDVVQVSVAPGGPIVTTGEGRFEHLGYIAGIGGQAVVASRTAVGLEVRRTAVGTFDMDIPGHYWTFTLSAARRW